jgi:hypothetical protein
VLEISGFKEDKRDLSMAGRRRRTVVRMLKGDAKAY